MTFCWGRADNEQMQRVNWDVEGSHVSLLLLTKSIVHAQEQSRRAATQKPDQFRNRARGLRQEESVLFRPFEASGALQIRKGPLHSKCNIGIPEGNQRPVYYTCSEILAIDFSRPPCGEKSVCEGPVMLAEDSATEPVVIETYAGFINAYKPTIIRERTATQRNTRS